ncbi:MAG: prepilin-type N-terminal cleavage/methylation domain-containing protein [Armatimonadota bacterium]|nr:MAG: prepilin-type N-terminal cleavage/methylation domain-containing protein [Armatimonadota bacterium]
MKSTMSSSQQRGVTLPEVLTAVMVLAVVIASVSAIYSLAMRAWYLGAAETYAQQKAAWVIQRMAPDLRQGMSVSPAVPPNESTYLVAQIPAKTYDTGEGAHLNQVAVDAYGEPYLVPGDYIIYYRGNESGGLDAAGDRVWRMLAHSDGTVVKQQVIADNIVDNPDDGTGNPKAMFIYWPDIYRLRSVEITITVEESRGHRTARKTMIGEVSLRNN